MILKRYTFYMRNSVSNKKKIVVKHSFLFLLKNVFTFFSSSLIQVFKYLKKNHFPYKLILVFLILNKNLIILSK